MLRFFAAAPAVFAPRALADGSSGTLGAASVGAYELRAGSVTLDRIADLPEGVLLGRAEGGGAPETLTGDQARALIAQGAPSAEARDVFEARALSPSQQTLAIRLLGWNAPGDGGAARYVAAAAEPAHDGAFQTADSRWWRLDEAEALPQMFGASGDGAGDDSAAIASAIVWQKETGGGIVLAGDYAVAGRINVLGRASIRGASPRHARLLLSAAGAQVKIGGAGYAAGDANLARFDIDGQDTVDFGLVLSEDERANPVPLGWSVWTGGTKVSDVAVSGCRTVGLHVGADSDNSQFHMVASSRHRAEGTAADAARIEAPSHYVQCMFGGCTGYALRADVAASGSETPETVYTVDSSRLNFARKGLVYHDGVSDAGPGGALGVFDKCFFENCGFAGGGEFSEKEPVDEAALEPAVVHCAGGRLNIVNPKKLQSGWGRALIKASGAGRVRLVPGGCELAGNSVPGMRACAMLVAGLQAGDAAQVEVAGRVSLKTVDGFAEIGRIAPRLGDFGVVAPEAEMLWRADVGDLSGWSAQGGALSLTTQAARTLSAGSAITLSGAAGASDNSMSATLRLPEAEGRVILLQAVLMGEAAADPDRLGLACRLEGAGLAATTAPADEIIWTQDVGGAGAGWDRWVHLCAAAYVSDGTEDVVLRLFSGRSRSGETSEARVHLGMARILIL
ncbi:MAG: hypothetical protein ACQEUZ_05850 [Pseudomonadota bacterium]